MNKKNRMKLLLLIVITVPVLFFQPTHGKEGKDSPEFWNDIVTRLREKYLPAFEKYKGVQSMRHVEMKEMDSRNGKLKSTSKMKVFRKDYFYLKPEVRVLEYIKNGKEMAPADLKMRRDVPGHPVFDKNGEKNYTLKPAGYETIGDNKCYRFQVIPKMITTRHFKGYLYYRTDTLEQVYAVGTMAKLTYPLKKFDMEFHTVEKDGVPMIESGSVTIVVHVPVIYPYRKFVSSIKASDSVLIQ